MPDYSKGKIYTIRFNDDNNIYVGSSIQPLSVRFGEHKRKQKSPVYIYIFEKYNGDFKNCYIELYEEFPCESKEQLCKREGEIIRLIGTLNKRIAGRKMNEYHQDFKEIMNEKSRHYHHNNKDTQNEKRRQRYKQNKDIENQKVICECGCEITKRRLNTHKQSKKHIDLMSQNVSTNSVFY
jgi:hypothetical protein